MPQATCDHCCSLGRQHSNFYKERRGGLHPKDQKNPYPEPKCTGNYPTCDQCIADKVPDCNIREISLARGLPAEDGKPIEKPVYKKSKKCSFCQRKKCPCAGVYPTCDRCIEAGQSCDIVARHQAMSLETKDGEPVQTWTEMVKAAPQATTWERRKDMLDKNPQHRKLLAQKAREVWRQADPSKRAKRTAYSKESWRLLKEACNNDEELYRRVRQKANASHRARTKLPDWESKRKARNARSRTARAAMRDDPARRQEYEEFLVKARKKRRVVYQRRAAAKKLDIAMDKIVVAIARRRMPQLYSRHSQRGPQISYEETFQQFEAAKASLAEIYQLRRENLEYDVWAMRKAMDLANREHTKDDEFADDILDAIDEELQGPIDNSEENVPSYIQENATAMQRAYTESDIDDTPSQMSEIDSSLQETTEENDDEQALEAEQGMYEMTAQGSTDDQQDMEKVGTDDIVEIDDDDEELLRLQAVLDGIESQLREEVEDGTPSGSRPVGVTSDHIQSLNQEVIDPRLLATTGLETLVPEEGLDARRP